MKTVGKELRLRITVVDPPAGVAFAVQRGRADLLAPSAADSGAIVFDLSIRLDGQTRDGGPRLLGEFAQGPPTARFVYVNSGTLAGQGGSSFTRRAKVPLGGLAPSLLEQALRTPGAVLETRIHGRARDGGPACATVPLLDGGWRLAASGRRGREGGER